MNALDLGGDLGLQLSVVQVVAVTATPAAAADDGPTPDAVRCTTWSAACEVGCRRHPSPRLGETSPAVRRATVRVAVWHPSRIGGEPGRSSHPSTWGDFCLERRACRPARGPLVLGGRSPPASWRSWPATVSLRRGRAHRSYLLTNRSWRTATATSGLSLNNPSTPSL